MDANECWQSRDDGLPVLQCGFAVAAAINGGMGEGMEVRALIGADCGELHKVSRRRDAIEHLGSPVLYQRCDSSPI